MIASLLSRMPSRFQWAPHNLIAHPISEFLWWAGCERASNWIHDVTVPLHERGQGRG